MTLSCTLALPADYRTADVFAYHLRDEAGLSEQLHGTTLHKGWVWQDAPARLELRFEHDRLIAHCHVVDGTMDARQFSRRLRHLAGLDQDIAGFESAMATHPEMAALIRRQKGLRVAVTATPYESLVWAICGQQISVLAAVAIRRRLIQAAGRRYSDALWCHPGPQDIARLSQDQLREAGLSTAKAQTLAEVTRLVLANTLPLDTWLDELTIARQLPASSASGSDGIPTPTATGQTISPQHPATKPEEIRDALLAIRGIGPWTANYVLLRGFGWLDGSLHGDVAVRRSLQRLLGLDDRISATQAQDWLATLSPWRALAAAHLWTALKIQA